MICPSVRQNDDENDGSDCENILPPNYCKFAVECDRNSKLAQKVQKLLFFEKKRRFFLKKPLDFSKSVKVADLL